MGPTGAGVWQPVPGPGSGGQAGGGGDGAGAGRPEAAGQDARVGEGLQEGRPSAEQHRQGERMSVGASHRRTLIRMVDQDFIAEL